MNFLEQLVAEWYEYSGYFVRTNVRARKRSRGGWEAELDVLAFLPSENKLIHIEASGDAESWQKRKQSFLKKFVLNKSEYEGLVKTQISTLCKVAVVGWSRKSKSDLNWGKDIKVLLIPNFLEQIVTELCKHDLMSELVPEGYPILRTIQMLLYYCKGLKKNI